MGDVSNWMLVDRFTVNQVSALWCEIDPATISEFIQRQPFEVAAVHQMLAGAIEEGTLESNYEKLIIGPIGGFGNFTVTRKSLEAFARTKNQFPKFLFDTLAPIVPQSNPLDFPDIATAPPVPPIQPSDPSKTKDRGGRPPEYDWDRFVLEIIRIANSIDGLPDKQSELTNQMLEWFSTNYSSEPAESTVRTRISKIYKYLEQNSQSD